MRPETFRARHPARAMKAAGLIWQVIETAAPRAAPTLVMLPGTLGTAAIFWNQIVALKGKARIVAVTYPQVGDIVRIADSLAALFDKLAIDRAFVVGSSMGGYLAQVFAARHPGRVAKIFVGNGLSNPGGPHPSGMTAAALAAQPAAFHRKMILDSVRAWPVPSPAFARMHEILIESGTKLLTARALKARVLAVRAGPEVPQLALAPSQVEIIDCADDPLIPRAVQDDVVRRYPGAQHHRLALGGHYPYVVDPDTYTAILARGMGIG